MIEVRVPAFRESGEMTTLAEILDEVGGQVWTWRLLYFEGTSRLDSSLNVLELEHAIDEAVQGLDFSWSALVALARDVDQAIDAVIVAFRNKLRCVLVIEVRDGTLWRILADNLDQEAVAAAERIASLRYRS